MTQERNLQLVREACIAANPEIVSKKFGCIVLLKPTRRGVLYSHKFPSKRFWKNDDCNRWETENGWIDDTEMNSLIINEDAEIIGHPIRLADVLLAIKSSSKCDTYWEYEAIKDVVWGKSMHGEHPWNLRRDNLEEQSDECLQFLAGLLL